MQIIKDFLFFLKITILWEKDIMRIIINIYILEIFCRVFAFCNYDGFINSSNTK